MEIQNFLKSKQGKFLWGMILILSIVYIVKSGYLFGQWLHEAIN